MANCQNCGTQLGNEKFCGGCGTPVPTAGATCSGSGRCRLVVLVREQWEHRKVL